MPTNILYKVYPIKDSSMTHIVGTKGKSSIISAMDVLTGIISLAAVIWFIMFLLHDGGNLLPLLGFIVLIVIVQIVRNYYQKEADMEFRIQKAQQEAELLSQRLNDILTKSEQIVHKILPYFEMSASKSIDIAKTDLSENAISPFWDKIEETSRYLGLFKEAVDQLILNGEIYSKILVEKKHNFPIPFPIGTNISISETLINDYNSIVRTAQTKFEFANIWEHRKTQKILVAGFQTLEQAINNMKYEILSAIQNLKHSIKSEFRELRNIQIEQIKSIEAGNAALNKTLTSMDTKLYYLEYNKKPTTPFLRPFFD